MTAWLDSFGTSLNPAQREAVRGLATSDAALATLVGPAGTGKSYVAGLLDTVWRDLTAGEEGTPGGRVIGVASTQVAADILREDGVSDTANVAAFLAAQRRLTGGSPIPADSALQLGAHDVLLVDEASMVDTYALTRLQATVDAVGARMILMGDPHQLGAIGAGGMMRAAIDRDAETYTLSRRPPLHQRMGARRHPSPCATVAPAPALVTTGSPPQSPSTTPAAASSTPAPPRTPSPPSPARRPPTGSPARTSPS